MFCTKCGKELFDEAVICPQCGTPTGDEQQIDNQNKGTGNVAIKVAGVDYEITDNPNSSDFVIKHYFVFIFYDDHLTIEIHDPVGNLLLNTVNTDYNSLNYYRSIKSCMGTQFVVFIIKTTDFCFSLFAYNSNPEKTGLQKLGYFRLLNKLSSSIVKNSSPELNDAFIYQLEEEIKRRKS